MQFVKSSGKLNTITIKINYIMHKKTKPEALKITTLYIKENIKILKLQTYN